MSREDRIKLALETVAICDASHSIAPGGERVDIVQAIRPAPLTNSPIH
jgi:hypothetical protein